jgi:hypothetical protein
MKEKFKEIAEQAGMGYVGLSDTTDLSEFDVEKFAELIIAECIDTIDKTPRNHGSTSYELSIIDGTKERCIKNIKRRFGYIVN